MGYYIRLLTPSVEHVPSGDLAAALMARVPGASLSCDAGSEDQWEQLVLSNTQGVECVVVERVPVADSESLGFEELQEFREEIQSCQPQSAVHWLNEYFGAVRAIYAFQVLSSADEGDGWRALEAVKVALWRRLGGIFQADSEGFSNEDGYHILWQFSERASGDWWMAVRNDERWVRFQMDLGNPDHRDAFKAGKVPAGIAPQG